MAHCTEAVWGMLSLMVMTSLGGSSDDIGLLPRFLKDVPNITVTVGRDALLPCTVEQLRGFKVAWVQVDTQTILTIHKQVITRNPRIALLHNDHRSWHLELKNVKESDRGWYMCQVNTDPMRFKQGYVDVVVPPDIIDKDSSGDITVREGQDVTLTCRAEGHPPPNITWRREDNKDIILHNNQRGRTTGRPYQGTPDSQPSLYGLTNNNNHSEDRNAPPGHEEDENEARGGHHRGWTHGLGNKAKTVEGGTLLLKKVSRLQMGSYLCIASNGVPPSISKRAHLKVQFPPMTWVPQQLEGAYPGQEEMTIECQTEAFPKSINYWTGPNGEMIVPGPKFEPLVVETAYKVEMRLKIRDVETQDFGTYRCVAKNSLGETDGSIRVYAITPPNFDLSSGVTEVSGEGSGEVGGARVGHSTATPPYKQDHEKGHSPIYEYPLEGMQDFEGTGGGVTFQPSPSFLVVVLLGLGLAVGRL
ncbi:neurotrimin-like isoform X2 [Eriocheir sinensis]|uniref:neurotrimin-like isoform X2 n=1 Tax=Eriocheir sinensis TaxID=95602 RepID=UPI0021C97BC7|nr:neurotrimin-like isoform X2 [Eriocheir sinensis]